MYRAIVHCKPSKEHHVYCKQSQSCRCCHFSDSQHLQYTRTIFINRFSTGHVLGRGGGQRNRGKTNVWWTYTGTKNQMFVQAHILVIAHTYTHMHACLHTCTHTHAHTHTHTPLDCSGNAPKLTQQPASSWPSSDWCDTSTGRSSPLKPHWTCKKQLKTHDNCVLGCMYTWQGWP